MPATQELIHTFSRSLAHQKRAHQLIPGAAHTYAKGDDQFPQGMCPVIARGMGARVWDIDGNEFVEYGAGVRSITLGHGYKSVCDAAYQPKEAKRGRRSASLFQFSEASQNYDNNRLKMLKRRPFGSVPLYLPNYTICVPVPL